MHVAYGYFFNACILYECDTNEYSVHLLTYGIVSYMYINGCHFYSRCAFICTFIIACQLEMYFLLRILCEVTFHNFVQSV